VPLVVFPEDGDVRRNPVLDTGPRGLLPATRGALLRLRELSLSATRRSQELEGALHEAARAARSFAASLALALPDARGAGAYPRSPVHLYFGVRVAPLSPEQHAAQAAAILFRGLADLRHAMVDVNDIATEVEGMCAVLDSLAPSGQRRAPTAMPGHEWPGSDDGLFEPTGDGLDRWVLVHHLYILFNLYAAAAVRAAISAISATGGSPDAAANLLGEAEVYVRAFSATMVHAAAVPSRYYREWIRPTMQPPAVPEPLTGELQPEHASYRSGIEDLLRSCPEPFLALTRSYPELALARYQLLEADLLDIERHTLVAAALVGTDRSLVQHEQAPDNAVSTLRRMRHRRAAAYRPFTRFGDGVLLDEEEWMTR